MLTPYQAEKPRIPLDERNPQKLADRGPFGAPRFQRSRLNDDDEMNDILWLAIRAHRSARASPQHVRKIKAFLVVRFAPAHQTRNEQRDTRSVSMVHLCFVWHMHQPFYKDLVVGRIPPALDAYACAQGLLRHGQDAGRFPKVHQTFNLVPSMMVQIEEYAAGEAADPFLDCALKPAEDLTEAEQEFMLRYFFQANPDRMIYRYPRYGELFDAWKTSGANAASGAATFRHAGFARPAGALAAGMVRRRVPGARSGGEGAHCQGARITRRRIRR